MERFDVAVVGAGPAGSMAAWALSRAGLDVVVLERGDVPGAKTMFGGVLYTALLHRFFPDFRDDACVERAVVEKRFAMLAERDEISLGFRLLSFDPPLYNHSFTALRSRFDPWLAAKAEGAGATIITSTVVDEVIVENGRVAGVKARREGGEIRANVVVAGDGANSLLAQSAGLRGELPPSVVLGVKEVCSLPRGVIEDRFALEDGEGAAFEYMGGEAVRGAMGGAFVYTNLDTLSVGLACPLHSLEKLGAKPRDLLEHFKSHPAVRRWLRGTTSEEFSAALIPELPLHDLPRVVTDGMVVVGAAAGLVNSNPLFHEGMNLAMASGLLAAETILEAHQIGDFSASTLCRYAERLVRSFAWEDTVRSERLARLAESHPRLFSAYPYTLAAMAKELFAIRADGAELQTPKRKLELAAIDHFLAEIGLFRFVQDLGDVGRAIV
ncbi:MAG TPA: FAD-dependent oxidoreductase [Candidatus Binatia bacterium]|nr:FAD-dependent oxidoreductase [Candidatus Binatia bacterium]